MSLAALPNTILPSGAAARDVPRPRSKRGCSSTGSLSTRRAAAATINPATGETLAEMSAGDARDIDRAVAAARRAFRAGVWSARAALHADQVGVVPAGLTVTPAREPRGCEP